ncbi:haloacid dehalogenase [Mycobacterium kyorinense]|uniref:Haloacid dehalogenase n=1 Tax=Mycobacterium kyorinense TaxID=487514 RepID=A0A1A2ZK99_9MYCO|nr:HAD family hydrolase [Mycobacterium kyorinense]OBI50685.1 haloacid dehalogenase [Mycobacterium kyorinense]
MNQPVKFVRDFDPTPITTLLCDADDNLFPSEKPAFAASVEVINRFLARFDVSAPFTAEQLRKQAVGKNFRSTALDLAVQAGVSVDPDELEQWVRQEREQVTAHLAATLKPDPHVLAPLQALASRYALAAVSSSATKRLDACFAATDLDPLIPAALRFSAEDSLPVPTSKPDPAVYLHTGQVMDVEAHEGLAVEDSVAGVTSAVAAGYLTVGNLMFVSEDERRCRSAELIDAGAVAITDSWQALADVLMLSPVTGGSFTA